MNDSSAAQDRGHPFVATGTAPGTPAPSAASVDWEKLAHHFADLLVERWHRPNSAHALPLEQFMGLSGAQYAAWIECRYDDVLAGGDDD